MVNMSTTWTLTENGLPPENVKLDTLSEGGLQQELIFHKQFWWYPDMSMYVYYTPKYWRETCEQNFAPE